MTNDERYMLRAIEVGERARLLSPPNPWVGCVLVKNGQIIAEGFTQPPGEDHAEVQALREAGLHAEGATAYVTLEPCAHFGRTPPCTKALIEAGIVRVVVALQDPDALVSGKGIAVLQEAGIEVDVGVCRERAENSLRPYLYHRKTGRAYCILKTAISLDGRVAAEDRTSRWISSEEARLDVHLLRANSQAIMVGSGTAKQDKPALTVRGVPLPKKQPLRILFDRQGVVAPFTPLFDVLLAPTLVITSTACSTEVKASWEKSGASIYIIENDEPFENVLSYLGSIGIIQLLVEGGPSLQTSILKQRACQELVFYVGAVILGSQGVPVFGDLSIPTIKEALPLQLNSVSVMGDSLKIHYSLI